MTQHPITPSDELIGKWIDTDEGGPNVISRIANRAAQWGADQELDACCRWISDDAEALRVYRRPKPPSLKEQALTEFDSLLGDSEHEGAAIILRALEQLPDNE